MQNGHNNYTKLLKMYVVSKYFMEYMPRDTTSVDRKINGMEYYGNSTQHWLCMKTIDSSLVENDAPSSQWKFKLHTTNSYIIKIDTLSMHWTCNDTNMVLNYLICMLCQSSWCKKNMYNLIPNANETKCCKLWHKIDA